MRRLAAAALAASVAAVASGCATLWRWRDTSRQDAERLATLMRWEAGSVVADVGAGRGTMAFIAARHVGPTGTVFATEVDPERLAQLKEKARQLGLANVAVMTAGEDATGLPPECCDAVYLREVYHHFARPQQMAASLFATVKEGGMLAVLHFSPSLVTRFFPAVPGMPPGRTGHGVEPEVVARELSEAGFVVEQVYTDWPGRDFCVLFRKP